MKKFDLYDIANQLNNHPAHVTQDKVTIMGFMTIEECLNHIEKLKEEIKQWEKKNAN